MMNSMKTSDGETAYSYSKNIQNSNEYLNINSPSSNFSHLTANLNPEKGSKSNYKQRWVEDSSFVMGE